MSRVEKVREFRILTRCGLKTAIDAVDGGWNPGDQIDQELTARLDDEHRRAAQVRAAAPALLEALKGLVGLECPIRVKDPFGAAVVDHWTEQKAQGHGYAHLYLNALAAISSATGGE